MRRLRELNKETQKLFHTSCTDRKNVLKNDDEDDGLTVAVPLRFVSSKTRRKCDIVCD